MTKLKMKIDGMTCGACADTVFKAITSLNGVSEAKVDLSKGTASAVYDEKTVSEKEILTAITDSGFTATVKRGIF